MNPINFGFDLIGFVSLFIVSSIFVISYFQNKNKINHYYSINCSSNNNFC